MAMIDCPGEAWVEGSAARTARVGTHHPDALGRARKEAAIAEDVPVA